jgi:hypothetical protein
MNTARNAKGVDIFATNQSGTETFTVQVKKLSKPNWTTVGRSPVDMTADYLVVCDNLDSRLGPRLFAAPKNRVRNILTRDNGPTPRDGAAWLGAKRYRTFGSLERVIGRGFK